MTTDFQLTNNDLTIANNDFAIAESDNQHLYDIINSFPGWWKEFPQVGVGIQNYVNSSGKQQELSRNMRVQLEADGYTVNSLTISQLPNGTFTIQTDAARI